MGACAAAGAGQLLEGVGQGGRQPLEKHRVALTAELSGGRGRRRGSGRSLRGALAGTRLLRVGEGASRKASSRHRQAFSDTIHTIHTFHPRLHTWCPQLPQGIIAHCLAFSETIFTLFTPSTHSSIPGAHKASSRTAHPDRQWCRGRWGTEARAPPRGAAAAAAGVRRDRCHCRHHPCRRHHPCWPRLSMGALDPGQADPTAIDLGRADPAAIDPGRADLAARPHHPASRACGSAQTRTYGYAGGRCVEGVWKVCGR